MSEHGNEMRLSPDLPSGSGEYRHGMGTVRRPSVQRVVVLGAQVRRGSKLLDQAGESGQSATD